MFFDLMWSNGRITKRDVQFQSLESAIRFLKERLKYVPEEDLESLKAEIFAEVRKPIGSMGRVSLASCVGAHSLPELIKEAEHVWNELEHENDDQKVFVPSDV